MWLRLRQIALVAEELAPVEADLIDVLGVKVCFNDPGVGTFGLHNALYPVGSQFIEVVAPIDPAQDTAGKRYLDRRGGDGGYMVITQCDDQAPRRAKLQELNIRLVSDHAGSSFVNMQLHPKDTGGSFFEIDQMIGEGADNPAGPWHPAGPDWEAGRHGPRTRHLRSGDAVRRPRGCGCALVGDRGDSASRERDAAGERGTTLRTVRRWASGGIVGTGHPDQPFG